MKGHADAGTPQSWETPALDARAGRREKSALARRRSPPVKSYTFALRMGWPCEALLGAGRHPRRKAPHSLMPHFYECPVIRFRCCHMASARPAKNMRFQFLFSDAGRVNAGRKMSTGRAGMGRLFRFFEIMALGEVFRRGMLLTGYSRGLNYGDLKRGRDAAGARGGAFFQMCFGSCRRRLSPGGAWRGQGCAACGMRGFHAVRRRTGAMRVFLAPA